MGLVGISTYICNKNQSFKYVNLSYIDPMGYGNDILVGGFEPSEKYDCSQIISPNRDENKQCLKPPPSKTQVFKHRKVVQQKSSICAPPWS